MTEPSHSENRPRLQEVPANSADVLRQNGFLLDVWWVEPRRNRIVSEDSERRLDPRLMEVLVHLAARAGEVITRDELSDAVWKDTFISENTVSQAVSRLRKALGDDSQQPRFIETISKSGYRLVAAVQRRGEPKAVQEAETLEATAPIENAAADGGPGAWSQTARISLMVVAALAAGLFGSWLWMGRAVSPPGAAAPRLTPELTLVGSQFEPILSPLGDQVAFCWRDDPQSPWSIWIQAVGADNPVRLTDGAANERLPTWSPDGASIAYVRYGEEPRTCGIYRSTILGGPAEHLRDCSPRIRSLHWSPDGKTLAMSLNDSEDEPLRIELLDIGTGTTRGLTTPQDGILGDRGPIFSPDGTQIAFERRLNVSRHDVMVVNTAGGEPLRLTDDAWGQMRGLDWRSDGKAVIFSSNRAGQFSLWQVPVEGGEPARLPIEDTWVTQPSVSRNGGRLIYRTFRDVVDIWSLPLDADGVVSGEPDKRVSSTRSERHPQWSPTGDAIAFISDRSGSTELWSGQPDGRGFMRHTDLAGPLPGSPSWSPDGSRVLFDAAVDGHADLWIVARDSRHPTQLTEEPSEERNGTFSRDGRWIYFTSDRSGDWQVWRMPSAGGAATAVTDDGGFLAQESIDGHHLYYVKLNEPGIWRMPLLGEKAEVVLSDLNLSDWGSWVVGRTGIYFVRRNPTTIQFVSFADGTIREVFAPSRQMPYLGRALSLSGDGRSLLFAMINHSDDEVMRVDLAGL
jgi:Tol biopolymer transport system component/DNA-binding winged helix-turn-helix (wHTH) protein